MRYNHAHCHSQVNPACNWLVNGISPLFKRTVWGNKEAGWGDGTPTMGRCPRAPESRRRCLSEAAASLLIDSASAALTRLTFPDLRTTIQLS